MTRFNLFSHAHQEQKYSDSENEINHDSFILGDEEQVNINKWLVYIMNESSKDYRSGGEHTFLLLEGVKNSYHILYRYELVTPNNNSALILVREKYHEKLEEMQEEGNHRKWQYKYMAISRKKAESLIDNIHNDSLKGERGELNFQLSGKAENSYNCAKWAKEKLKEIDVSIDQNPLLDFYSTYIFNKPSKVVSGGREFLIDNRAQTKHSTCNLL